MVLMMVLRRAAFNNHGWWHLSRTLFTFIS